MPFAPSVKYKGSDYLFQGISQAGQSISAGLGSYMDQYKKDKDMASAASSFFKAKPDALSTMGVHPEEFANMSAADKGNLMTSYAHVAVTSAQQQAQQIALQNADQQRQLQAAHMQRYAALAQQDQAGMAADAAVGPFMQDYTQGAASGPQDQTIGQSGLLGPGAMDAFAAAGQPYPDPTGAPSTASAAAPMSTDARFWRAAAANPAALASPRMAGIMNAYEKLGGAGANQGFFTPDQVVQDLPGLPNLKRVVTGRNTSQVVGTGEVPAGLPEIPGHVPVPTGKGGVAWLKIPENATGKLMPALNQKTGEEIPGMFIDQAGKTHDLRSQMQKMGETSTPPPPAAASGPGFFSRLFGGGSAPGTNAPAAGVRQLVKNPETGRWEFK
jgi:hypothetical protein